MQKTRNFRYWIEFRFKLLLLHFMIDIDSRILIIAIKNVWKYKFNILTFFYESDGNWKKNWQLLNGSKNFFPTYLAILPICINTYIKEKNKKDIVKMFLGLICLFFIKLFTYFPAYVCSVQIIYLQMPIL